MSARRGGWQLGAALSLVACTRSPAEPQPQPQALAAPVAAPTASSAPAGHHVIGRWWQLDLPEGGSASNAVPVAQIDAVYQLSAVDQVTLTVLRPMPHHNDLAPWIATVTRVFADRPAVEERDATLDGLVARVQTTDRSERWVFVTDGYGMVILCGSESPHPPAWIREHCAPTLASFHIVRPISD